MRATGSLQQGWSALTLQQGNTAFLCCRRVLTHTLATFQKWNHLLSLSHAIKNIKSAQGSTLTSPQKGDPSKPLQRRKARHTHAPLSDTHKVSLRGDTL